MRVLLLIHDQAKQHRYTGFLLDALLRLFTDADYEIREATSFREIPSSGNGKIAFVVRLPKKRFAFFQQRKLASFSKKQNIRCVIQITDKETLSVALPQLLVSSHVEQTIAQSKPSSSLVYAVGSYAAKQKVAIAHPLVNNQVSVIPMAADEAFQPTSWSEQQAIKMQYTQGREFFLVRAENKTAADLLSLLKAFSAFKKWQHSSMKLLGAGTLSFRNDEDWQEKINTYKYRDDVVLLSALSQEEYMAVLAAAYVFLHVPAQEDDLLPLLEAMQSGAPCLCFDAGSLQEYASHSAILIEPGNYEQVGDKMILLYKDEALRSRLISDALAGVQQYTKAASRQALQEAISNATGEKI